MSSISGLVRRRTLLVAKGCTVQMWTDRSFDVVTTYSLFTCADGAVVVEGCPPGPLIIAPPPPPPPPLPPAVRAAEEEAFVPRWLFGMVKGAMERM